MYTSPYADVEIPNVSVHEFLFGSLQPEDLSLSALIDSATGAETSYGELAAQIDAFAGALAARGAGHGRRAALPERARLRHRLPRRAPARGDRDDAELALHRR
jgi:hypothetical protein